MTLDASDARSEHGGNHNECKSEILYLKDGEQLSGTSLGLSAGALKWEMPYGSVISIPFDEISRIEYVSHETLDVPPPPEKEAMKSGHSELPQEFPSFPDDGTPERFMRDDPWYSPLTESLANGRDLYYERLEYWHKRFEFGVFLFDGNRDQEFVHLSGDFERWIEGQFADIDFGGQLGKSNGDTTTNRWWFNATLDYDHQENWILFVIWRNEFDEFENLDYRTSLGTGLGYRLIYEEHKRLVVRLGFAATSEIFHDPEINRTTLDLLTDIEIRYPLKERLYFDYRLTLLSSLEGDDLARLVETIGLLFALDDDEHWMFKIGLRHEYNSQPNDQKRHADYTTTFNMVYIPY